MIDVLPRPATVTPPVDPAPLADWTRRIRAGDLSAFEALFRALHAPLVRFARTYTPRPEAADDVVQEAFARLWERRDRLDPERSVRALLFQAVRNRALNASRDRRTREDLLQQHAEAPASGPLLPDDLAHGETLGAHLRRCLDALPDRQREALTLTRLDGLSHAEAADIMGCAARTVNNHIVRGLHTLRERLHAFDPDAF
ncbi:MAG: sigma-70 family RNA polymerase sigma factor [Bacteroidota bacterium]